MRSRVIWPKKRTRRTSLRTSDSFTEELVILDSACAMAQLHEKLRADIDEEMAEQHLTFFELGSVEGHREKKVSRELPAETGDGIEIS